MRKSFVVLSVAAIAVGVWLLVRAHPVNAVCSANRSPLTGAGVSANCMNMISFYFIGFALVIVGLITLMLAVLSMAKHARHRRDYHRDVAPTPPHQLHAARETLRDVA